MIEYVKHRQKVITRRTIFELTAAKRRAHILEGLKIALDNLDEVIATIRKSRTQEEAKLNLIKKFHATIFWMFHRQDLSEEMETLR